MKNYDRMYDQMMAFEAALTPDDVIGRTLNDVFNAAPHAIAYDLAKAHGDVDLYYGSSIHFSRLWTAIRKIGCDARGPYSPIFSYMG